MDELASEMTTLQKQLYRLDQEKNRLEDDIKETESMLQEIRKDDVDEILVDQNRYVGFSESSDV
jgi:chaperonin cofactor prefoldin